MKSDQGLTNEQVSGPMGTWIHLVLKPLWQGILGPILGFLGRLLGSARPAIWASGSNVGTSVFKAEEGLGFRTGIESGEDPNPMGDDASSPVDSGLTGLDDRPSGITVGPFGSSISCKQEGVGLEGLVFEMKETRTSSVGIGKIGTQLFLKSCFRELSLQLGLLMESWLRDGMPWMLLGRRSLDHN